MKVLYDCVMRMVGPGNNTTDNKDMVDAENAWFPAESSVQEADHYSQIMNSGKFQKFDHGFNENMAKYGQSTPPLIPVDTISKVPVALFVGGKDVLADPLDAKWLRSQIKSVVHYQEIPSYDHGSFNCANDVSYLENAFALSEQYKTMPNSLMNLYGMW